MFGKSIFVIILLTTSSVLGQITPAEYSNIQSEFSALHGTQTFFPVAGKTTDDVESTFGPRIQHTTGLYDFHRGIDVDGDRGDDILSTTNGVFWEHRTFTRGGLAVILRHDFANPVTLNGNSYDHYFTYYMHLYDDNVQGNGIGTLDVIDGWVSEKANSGQGTLISAGDHIGELGNSGSSGGLPYSDHLHMEIRVGTTNSLIFQTDNPTTSQHGFDPHVHPMLFFESAIFDGPDYSPTLTAQGILDESSDLTIAYETSNKGLILNRLEFSLIDLESNLEIASHELDFNLRTGFDATNFADLDSQDILLPYIDPVAFSHGDTVFTSNIVVPDAWLSSSGGPIRLEVEAFDIWGNATTLQLSSVPEPQLTTLLSALLLSTLVTVRRRPI